MKMEHTVADALAKSLVMHGVEQIFGQSNPTALMLAAEQAGIRQVFYRTENAAGAMADAFARVTNQVGVVAAQNGPAAALMVAPMAEAMKVSIPMLVIVQEVPAHERDKNAFQEYDHFALFGGVAKWIRRVDDPQRAVEYLDLALIAANSGKPGPVVLLVAKDVLVQPSSETIQTHAPSLLRFPLDRPRPDAGLIAQAANLLATAQNPVIIAGGGVHGSQAAEQLSRLVALSHIPVATTHMGKGAVDETADFALGVAANITGAQGPAAAAYPLFQEADVVLLIGSRTNENGTDAWTLTNPEAQYIHIDMDAQEVGRNYTALRLVGDARAAIEDLTEALAAQDLTKRHDSDALRAQIQNARTSHIEAARQHAAAGAPPITPQRLMADLNEFLNPTDIVVADASYSSVWVTGCLTCRAAGQRFLTPRGLAGLGWGLPFALGAKLAQPSARVVALVGDGGFAHVWAEIETAVREELAVVVIVLNNSRLAMQRHGEMVGFGTTTTAIELGGVDHALIAQAAGAKGVRIEEPEAFKPALKNALEADGVTVLDVISDPDAFAALRLFDGKAQVLAS